MSFERFRSRGSPGFAALALMVVVLLASLPAMMGFNIAMENLRVERTRDTMEGLRELNRYIQSRNMRYQRSVLAAEVASTDMGLRDAAVGAWILPGAVADGELAGNALLTRLGATTVSNFLDAGTNLRIQVKTTGFTRIHLMPGSFVVTVEFRAPGRDRFSYGSARNDVTKLLGAGNAKSNIRLIRADDRNIVYTLRYESPLRRKMY